MRAPLVAIASAFAAPACYSPTIDPCTVHCPNNAPCPGDSSCGTDSFCHPQGDTSNCSNTQFRVTINKTGNGTGTVGGAGGLSCGTACSAEFPQSTTPITLTAMRDSDSRFVQWNDAFCSGQPEQCMFPVDGDKTVVAEFHLAAQLTVMFSFNAGPMNGEVFSTPTGLDCTSDCTVAFDLNSQVTLTSTSPNFFQFDAPCPPNPATDCTVQLNGAVTVTAEFN